MSLSPAVIDALVASGCTVEQLAAAVKASMADAEERAAEKRSKDAERQRKHRANKQVSRDVTVTGCDKRDAPLSLPPNENISNPPTHTPGNNTPARKGTGTIAKPDGVTDQVWRDFLAHRKAKRATVTPTVIAGIGREAEKAGWSMDAALAECVTRGWQTFRADWAGGSASNPARPPGGQSTDYLDHLLNRRAAAD